VKHAIVTGGGRGIGAAIAAALTAAGHRVTVLGRTEAPLRERVEAAEAAAFMAVDVTDAEALTRAMEACGPADILVNNAGSAETAAFFKAEPAMFRRMLEVHLMAAVTASHALLPGMIAQRQGRLINVASTAALRGYGYVSAYCAAKHALLGFTRALAVETAKTGVTVNAVCPGYTATDMVQESVAGTAAKTGKSPESVLAAMLKDTPLGRLVMPQEVAASVVWLCSDAAAAVTGQAIAIDGGETMR
jgi:NAD(P)-dependent dehydrogenase (short-subunit alcohol dehydrogenase family)